VFVAKQKNYSTTTATNTAAAKTVSSTITSLSSKKERRVDIARREAVITALLDQVRPTLEATTGERYGDKHKRFPNENEKSMKTCTVE
jgi:hypothetical protein